MAAGRRCPVCRGPLLGAWGEPAAPNRRYCSPACRQTAYRHRATAPADRRRAAAARRAAVDAAAVDVDRLLAAIATDVRLLQAAVDRRSTHRLSYQVTELATTVDHLATAVLAYDRAGGATWAELADETGVDESTLRRRQRRGATDPV